MFGYVVINQPEMKFREYDVYRSYYCGLCKTIKRKYGNICRMALSYELNFLIIVLSGMYEPDTECESNKCFLHPVKKHTERINEITEYAADMNVILAYEKCMDDWKDERKKAAKLMSALLRGKSKQAEKAYIEKISIIEGNLKKLSEYEKAGENNIDKVAGCFGNVLAELYIYKHDEWEEELRRMGFYLGKFIYIMDAYEDIQEDLKKGNYNPLKQIYGESGFEEKCKTMLTMMITECARAFERLPIVQDASIIRNILYSGVWTKYNIHRYNVPDSGKK